MIISPSPTNYDIESGDKNVPVFQLNDEDNFEPHQDNCRCANCNKKFEPLICHEKLDIKGILEDIENSRKKRQYK